MRRRERSACRPGRVRPSDVSETIAHERGDLTLRQPTHRLETDEPRVQPAPRQDLAELPLRLTRTGQVDGPGSTEPGDHGLLEPGPLPPRGGGHADPRSRSPAVRGAPGREILSRSHATRSSRWTPRPRRASRARPRGDRSTPRDSASSQHLPAVRPLGPGRSAVSLSTARAAWRAVPTGRDRTSKNRLGLPSEPRAPAERQGVGSPSSSRSLPARIHPRLRK
jgi:hypothetical protein